MHLSTTAPQMSRDAVMWPPKKNFSNKILFTEFGSHKIMVGAQKIFFLVKINIWKNVR